jgi:hypothetical protein
MRAFFDETKKGDLPGRYVPAHVRKWPYRPNKGVNVRAYQETIEPIPSPVESVPRQGELDLGIPPELAGKPSDSQRPPN